jgi:hypothetical protein
MGRSKGRDVSQEKCIIVGRLGGMTETRKTNSEVTIRTIKDLELTKT